MSIPDERHADVAEALESLRLPAGAGAAAGRISAGRSTAAVGAGVGERTVVEIGSVTKPFTGLLLAVLATEGVVALRDPLARHVPEVRAQRSLRDVTLEQLATHTTGLPRLPLRLLLRGLRHPDEPYRGLTGDRLAGLAPLRARTSFRYSNYGYLLLGEALARAAGDTFDTVLRQRVLDPLGLQATGVGGDPAGGRRRSGRQAAAWAQPGAPGAGGLRSTLEDLLTFVESMLTPPSALGEAVSLALTPRVDVPARRLQVGLGWLIAGRNGRRVHFQNGATGGASAFTGFTAGTGVAAVASVGGLRELDRVGFRLLAG